CAHHGRTPPCAEALIAAQPGEVVIACPDPFDQVAGRGAAMLRAAGVPVFEGVRRAEAEALNAGFFSRLATGRPILLTDRRAGLFDAELALEAGEDESGALDRLGAAGVTRVRRG
ncbi:MAG: riboflavin biosynthesis protein RibD, partial [Oceanicaulis sp.]